MNQEWIKKYKTLIYRQKKLLNERIVVNAKLRTIRTEINKLNEML